MAVNLVLVAGFAGSGKTETGKLLADVTDWALVDKDTISRPFVEFALELLRQSPHDRESATYLERIRPLEYKCLLKTGWENLECGNSVILSAPFLREVRDPHWIRRVQRRCVLLGAQLSVAWVASDPASMRARLISRGADRDIWKLANWAEYVRTSEFAVLPCCEHRYVDNSLDAGQPLLDQILMFSSELAGMVTA